MLPHFRTGPKRHHRRAESEKKGRGRPILVRRTRLTRLYDINIQCCIAELIHELFRLYVDLRISLEQKLFALRASWNTFTAIVAGCSNDVRREKMHRNLPETPEPQSHFAVMTSRNFFYPVMLFPHFTRFFQFTYTLLLYSRNCRRMACLMLVFCGLQPRRKAGSGLPAGRPSCILLAIHLVFLFLLLLYNLLVIPAHIIHASDDGIESAWKGSWKRIFSRVYRLVAKIAVYWKRQQKKSFFFF